MTNLWRVKQVKRVRSHYLAHSSIPRLSQLLQQLIEYHTSIHSDQVAQHRWPSIAIAHPIGSSIIDFRVNNNGSLPTRMRSLFSWNVNSWRTFDSNEYKLRRCKRLLRKGPVCLQESKWTGTEVEYLYRQIPGIRVCHSAAVCCSDRIRTGGVAVSLPPGWKILEELELVPGRAVAVKVQNRTCQFLLMSVYIHLSAADMMQKPFCERGED